MANIDNGQPDETADGEQYPECPDCGERHPPLGDEAKAKAAVAFIQREIDPNLNAAERVGVYAGLLTYALIDMPTPVKLRVLTQLARNIGIGTRQPTPTDEHPAMADLRALEAKGRA